MPLVRPVRVLATALMMIVIGLVACRPTNDALVRATALHPEGREVFERYNCIRCHNAGEGGYGPTLLQNVNLRNLEFIKRRIREGKQTGAAAMPAFAAMPADELENVAKFVRALAGRER
jgi:mono/diheme cytochrome c family protein